MLERALRDAADDADTRLSVHCTCIAAVTDDVDVVFPAANGAVTSYRDVTTSTASIIDQP
jgi:hypothetical protein